MNKGFDKATFKNSVIDNVKNMFRRTIDEASSSMSGSQPTRSMSARTSKPFIIYRWNSLWAELWAIT